MLKKLKDILNTYTDEELEDIDLWINCGDLVNRILIENGYINLITDGAEIKVNGYIEQEGKNEQR